MFIPTPGATTYARIRPTIRARVVITSKYTSALPPTRPTFFRSPAPAMPCTTTQNTIGATIIEISFRKASLKILRLTAKSGTAIPSTIPSKSATRTWTNSDVYSGFRAAGAAVDMVDIGHPPIVSGHRSNKRAKSRKSGVVYRVLDAEVSRLHLLVVGKFGAGSVH